MPMEKFIDIEKIIRSKNPRLLKWMPGFLLRYVKRILHEKDINEFMARNGQLRKLDFVHKTLREFDTKIVTAGLENIPAKGGFILAANHPLGGFDGLALMEAVARKREDIQFLVNDILFSLGTMDDLFIPVNKHGSQSSINRIEETYKSENAVLIFPAGLVSRKQSGKVLDLEWKKSFITKAIQYNKQIIPTYIEGKNSSFFYNLSLWRKRLGIKANIEMFYLVNEMYKQQHKTITITFGKPINPDSLDQQKSPRELAALVKQEVYAIGDGSPGPFSDIVK